MLDTIDRKLLNLLQRNFPLVEEPFQELGKRLGVSEEEVLRRVRGLKEGEIVREIGPLFDGRSLGYRSSLIALRVAPERLDEAAAQISALPGVSHNYARHHPYNLWFTLALPANQNLEKAIEERAKAAGAEAILILPSLRVFKLGVYFDMLAGKGLSGVNETKRKTESPEGGSLSRGDREIIRELQEDLPLESNPFEKMAQRVKMGEGELLQKMKGLHRRGVLRRYGATLNHRKAGFTANAMVCWKIPEPQVEEVGLKMVSFPEVSHCYQRPTYPDWPYSLFTMIHAPTREKCEAMAREISRQTGVADYVTLYSTKEYKKAKVKYLMDD